jgi:hypothetical protein
MGNLRGARYGSFMERLSPRGRIICPTRIQRRENYISKSGHSGTGTNIATYC